MHAIQMTEFGDPDVLELVELPTPRPGPGEVLVRVESAAVNFADVMRRRDDSYPFPTPLPFVPDGEVAGTVEALGPDVDGPPVGTPVAVVGGDGSGGYAELAVAAAPQVIPIPPGLDPDEACGIVIAGTTAMLALTEEGALQPGETVLVPGAGGGVGSFAVQLARVLGAGTTIATASTPARRELALSLGADLALDPTRDGWTDELRAVTGGRGVDVALELSGGSMFADTLDVLAPFGRLVVLGRASGESAVFDHEAQHRFLYAPSPNQRLAVFNLGMYFGLRPEVAVRAMTGLIELVTTGEVTTQVSRTLPLADAATAHRLIESRESVGKLVLKP